MRHVSDVDIVRAADGELAAPRLAEVRAHLAECAACRNRMEGLDGALAELSRIQRRLGVPPADHARALLRSRMASQAAAPAAGFLLKLAFPVLLLAGFASLVLVLYLPSSRVEARSVPDPRLTPGATVSVALAELCSGVAEQRAAVVQSDVARQVFTAYGIREPRPRAYELDYLITPALGGSGDVRNFWPQPYRATVWNAHIKDALEDHLHRAVCAGEVPLATAQRDIARDWIAAYKKYFHTEKPLPEHYSFLKDRPWE